MQSNISIFSCEFCYGDISMNFMLNPRSQRFSPMFYFINCIILCSIHYEISCITFRPMIHHELSFVQDVKHGSNFILLQYPIALSPFVAKTSFPLTYSCIFVEKSVVHLYVGLLLDPILFHWYMCLSRGYFHTVLINKSWIR